MEWSEMVDNLRVKRQCLSCKISQKAVIYKIKSDCDALDGNTYHIKSTKGLEVKGFLI